jgi:hypothetical protein
MPRRRRIVELLVALVVDDGVERLLEVEGRLLLTTDPVDAVELRERAVAAAGGRRVVLARFAGREDVGTYKP